MIHLRRVFTETCRGYSTVKWRDQSVFIKHLTHFDQVDIDVFYEEALASAVAKGIKTREDKLKWLIDKRLWSTQSDIDLTQQTEYVRNQEKTLGTLMYASQVASMRTTLDKERAKLIKMQRHKEDLIGLTAEAIADRKIQFRYVLASFYEDPTLRRPMFTEDHANQWDDDDSYGLLDLYVTAINRFGQEDLRKIALAPFFTNYFYLCGDNVFQFFNKPVCELTVYQINLISYGTHFRNILKNNDVPDHIASDPDRLEDFVNLRGQFSKVLAKAPEGGRVGLFGNTQDFEALGIRDDTDSVRRATAKQHKSGMEAAKDLGFTVN